MESIDSYKKQVESLQNSYTFSRGLLKKVTRGLIICNENNGIISVNSYIADLLGRSLDELYEEDILSFIVPEYIGLLEKNLRSKVDIEYRIDLLHKDESGIPVRIKNGMLELNGRELVYLAIDSVSDLEKFDDSIKECGIKFRSLIKKSREAIAIINREGTVDYISESIEQMTGFSPFELAGLNLIDFIHSDDKMHFSKKLHYLCYNGKKTSKLEIRIQHKDGTWINAEIYASNLIDDSTINGVIFNIRDVTEIRRAQELAAKFQLYDTHVTKLPNASFLQNRLQMEIIKANERSNDNILAVMCIGIDKFRKINDLYGRDVGDKLLNKIAAKLTEILREDDLVARVSSDIFMILLANIADTYDFKDIIKKVRNVISSLFEIKGNSFHITAGIGMSIYPNDGNDVEILINNSQAAMFHAKSAGPNNYSFFNPVIHKKLLDNFQMEDDLKEAIVNNEFIMHYQPKFDGSNKIVGIESLIRWQSPERGLVQPNTFINLAEKDGMIVEIGYIIFRKVCEQVKKWSDMGFDKHVSINLAPAQFKDPEFVKKMKSIINETGLDKKMLELEITESSIIENELDVINKLNEFHEDGIEIAIDDFGKGLSSLGKLITYPIDTLKIDKSFIDKLLESEGCRNIVNSIIDLANNLGYKIVAEGIENSEQLDFLMSCNCHVFQGYFHSKPLTAEEFERIHVQGNN